MAISKNKIKQISLLHQKKHREEQALFIVEGEKTVAELLEQDLFQIQTIVALPEWVASYQEKLRSTTIEVLSVSSGDLERVSALKTPNKVLAVVSKTNTPIPQQLNKQLCLVLDNLQDPGNLGTIIRIADWFGIEHIFCSEGSVELYNPKVLQATVGSFLRVQVHYLPLAELFEQFPQKPRYGAVLQGEDIRKSALAIDAFLLIGNEGKGLSEGIASYITQPISIPRFGAAESLNAAVATGILCALFKL